MTQFVMKHSTGVTRVIDESQLAGHQPPDWTEIGALPNTVQAQFATVVDGVITADLTPAWEALRQERDARLAACDKVVLPDFPVSTEKRQEWLDYRQALRDLPEQTVNPLEPNWPIPPS